MATELEMCGFRRLFHVEKSSIVLRRIEGTSLYMSLRKSNRTFSSTKQGTI